MRSAGLLPYRFSGRLEVMIAHPGGPWFEKKDAGSWSLVKGLVKEDENDEQAAAREFEEETGWTAPLSDDWIPLGEATLRSRKVVVAWAVETQFEMDTFSPGTFTLYGREYPEIDRVDWTTPWVAREKLNEAQTVFIDRLERHLSLNG